MLKQKTFLSSKIFTNILLSVGVVLGVVSIVFVQVTQYRNQEIRLEELRAGDLQKGSVTFDKLADDVFTTVELEFNDGITSQAKVMSGTVQGGLLVGQLQLETAGGEVIEGTVTEYVPTPMEIEDGSITEEKLAKVLIDRIEQLEDSSEEEGIGEEEDTPATGIADGSIVTVKLAEGAVTTAKLADGSVTTIKIVDASITSGKLQDAVILTRHLGSSSVTSVKIADGTIVDADISGIAAIAYSKLDLAGSITNTDISNTAAIAYSKLNLTGSILLADLGQNGCTDGQVMKWDNGGSTWVCGNDTDTNTQLNESQVEGYITNGAIDLFTGSTMNSQALATESWVTGLGYITDGNTGWDNSYGFITGSSTEALTNKSGNISMWTNDSGYITDGNTDWNNSYGFITGSSTETLTNKSGNISMWTNDSGYITAASIAALTNKTIDGDDNTVQDLTVNSLKSGVLDTDLGSVSASDDTIASAKAIRTALNTLYPVGSVYINASDSTNPSTLFGFGTWVVFGEGQVMVGLDSGDVDFDTGGETGGEKTHTLTVAEIPSHTHIQNAHNHSGTPSGSITTTDQVSGTGIVARASNDSSYATATNQNTGGGESHNNLQPYIVVYMWVRTE